jgi:hypothetical protein
MAYRELGMVELQEILRRWLAGDSVRAIARATGMDRKTVIHYVRAARAAGVHPGGEAPTEEQVASIVATRRPGAPAESGSTHSRDRGWCGAGKRARSGMKQAGSRRRR